MVLFFRLAAGILKEGFFVASGEGFFSLLVLFFPFRGGEGACGPAHFALRAHLAFGKSLFRGELKLAYTPLHE